MRVMATRWLVANSASQRRSQAACSERRIKVSTLKRFGADLEWPGEYPPEMTGQRPALCEDGLRGGTGYA
jgi:hypothetical protein